MSNGHEFSTQKFALFYDYLSIIHENICIHLQNIWIIENQYLLEHTLLEDHKRVLSCGRIIIFSPSILFIIISLFIKLQLECRSENIENEVFKYVPQYYQVENHRRDIFIRDKS